MRPRAPALDYALVTGAVVEASLDGRRRCRHNNTLLPPHLAATLRHNHHPVKTAPMQSNLAPLSWSVLSSAAATGLVVPFPCLRSCPTAHTAERRWLTVMIGTVVLALVSVAMARAGNATASPSEDEAIPQLYAAVGGKVSLPCNTSIPAGGDGVSLILWYHGDYGIPIYSLDARDQPLGKARHFPGQDLGTRAYLDVSSKPPTLNIDPVLESDAGEYRCRVDYSRQRTQHRNVNLTVIGACRLYFFCTECATDIYPIPLA
ncbi:hypothetical protein MRX96_050196 [Rhipicephalus microplus]